MPAALASLAAREQGKFWPMHDKLFANFSQLSEEKIVALAKETGLDLVRFDTDRNAQKLRDEVVRDQGLGQQAGVQGTPTVFVNGKLLRDRSLPGVQAIIDREVAKSQKRHAHEIPIFAVACSLGPAAWPPAPRSRLRLRPIRPLPPSASAV